MSPCFALKAEPIWSAMAVLKAFELKYRNGPGVI